MILPGVGYLGQRMATSLARACGGDYWVQSQCRKLAAGLTVWFDPIGTGVGVAHEIYNLFGEAEKNEREARARAEGEADQP